MTEERKIQIVKCLVCLIIAALSFSILSNYASAPAFQENTITSLDEKKSSVLKLTAAATGVSAAITLIPGDTATPIAEQLAQLVDYFLIVLVAIYVEKYLVLVSGVIAFKVLIPIAFIGFAILVFWKNEMLRRFFCKLALFSFVLFLIVPASVGVSGLIENSYETSIDETIESAQKSATEIEESVQSANDEDEDASFISQIQDFFSTATSGLTGVMDYFEDLVSNFVEALAVMIVTSCLIPILVFFGLIWIAKMLFNLDTDPKKLLHGFSKWKDKGQKELPPEE